jgi:hypothetical protein
MLCIILCVREKGKRTGEKGWKKGVQGNLQLVELKRAKKKIFVCVCVTIHLSLTSTSILLGDDTRLKNL